MNAPQQLSAPPLWKTVHADRVAYLVDADAYFRAVTAAMARARHSIVVLGWDIDARTELPDPFRRHARISLRRLANKLAQRRKDLRIYFLGWDFSSIYTLERLPFPALYLDWLTHPRVHFVADGRHPPGASHHQKVVIVDDRVAFSGGIDLALRRWDTPRHTPDDTLRKDPQGFKYGPFHDVQIAVSGPAAKALGDVARERWRLATGGELPALRHSSVDPWPRDVRPDATGVGVHIARTLPAYEENETPCREVCESTIDLIQRAKHAIFVENQYFSSMVIARALYERLSEPSGPEIVAFAPWSCSGWLEENTMGLLRTRFFQLIRSARHAQERFRVVSPFVGDKAVYVHSKVLVIDDTFARVGSANWSTRSLGIDTECDVTVVAESSRPEHARAVASLRNRLLAEHLGTSEFEIASQLRQDPSIVQLIDNHASEAKPGAHARTLTVAPVSEDLSVVALVADPERPLDAAQLAKIFSRVVENKKPNARVYALALVLSAVAAVVILVVSR